jgi:hypothetical protein
LWQSLCPPLPASRWSEKLSALTRGSGHNAPHPAP